MSLHGVGLGQHLLDTTHQSFGASGFITVAVAIAGGELTTAVLTSDGHAQ